MYYSYHTTIKFTTESSDSSVSFLDVLVTRKQDVLETDLYCKLTSVHTSDTHQNQYLQKTSCHLGHVKKAIPYSQTLRIRRICSDQEKFRNRSEDLVGWLVQRGYKENVVREQVARANSLDRATLLSQESRCSEERKDFIPFVVSYHPALSELKGLVSRLQNMLEATEEHKSVFRQELLVVFRHAPNIKDSIVRAKLPKLQIESDKGCFRCGKSRCQICRFISEGNSFNPLKHDLLEEQCNFI